MHLKEIVNKKNILEGLKFLLVGGINAVILMGTYNLLLLTKMHYIIAYAIGFVASVVSAYFLNTFFVFKKSKKTVGIWLFIKVVLVYLTTMLLGMGLVYLLVDVLGMHEEIAPLINIIVMTPINYLLIKFWALRKKNKKNVDESEVPFENANQGDLNDGQ